MLLYLSNYISFLKNKLIPLTWVVFFLLLFVECNKENSEKFPRRNHLTNKTTSLSILEFKPENPKEWQISNNKIECLVSIEDRKINLLTRKLERKKENLEITVRLGFFNDNISNLNKNWAGFYIGSTSVFSKNTSIQKKGINIGVCTNGALFIGMPSLNHQNTNIINALKEGVDLKMSILNNQKNYMIDLSVFDIKTKKLLGRISKKNITEEQLIGDIGLISSFENLEAHTNNPKKSVWFQNWKVKE